MARLFALHSLILLSGFAFFHMATSIKPKGLVTSLIHRDSIFSPSYDPHHTAADRAKLKLRISDARFAYLQAKGAENVASADMQAELYSPDDAIFLVIFSVGQPPVSRVAVMDTGSSLTWIQCTPSPGSVFDPSKSSTYANMSCYDSTQCIQSHNPKIDCDKVFSVCTYETKYMDGTLSMGRMATEQLTFGTADDGESVTPRIIFGCCETTETQMTNVWQGMDGILGLGSEDFSIVHSLGSRFSYCLGNLNDPTYRFNQLAFGDWADLEGYSTPLQISSGHYEVTLEGISIGQERLDIDPSIFGRVIIDTGSHQTYLPFDAYFAIEDKVKSMLDGLLVPILISDSLYLLCYTGDMRQALRGFPVATLHLAEGADLVLDVDSLFNESNEGKEFCMSISPAVGSRAIPVIGVTAQQNYNFGYDLNEKRLYFQSIDCELLYD